MYTLYLRTTEREAFIADMLLAGIDITDWPADTDLFLKEGNYYRWIGQIPIPFTDQQIEDINQAIEAGQPCPHDVTYLPGMHVNILTGTGVQVNLFQNTVQLFPITPYATFLY